MPKKLTDSEIVKALSNMTYGGHYCAKCKYDNGKGDDRCGLKGCKIARYALDLINRQKADIKKLTSGKCVYLSDDETTEYCVEGPCPNYKTVAQIKAEAVTEFAAKVKQKRKYLHNYFYSDVCFGLHIDGIVDELVGVKK